MDVAEMYSKGKELLQKNLCIAIPTTIASIITGVVYYYYGFAGQIYPAISPPNLLFLKMFLFALLGGIISLTAEGINIIMSYEALEIGKTSLNSGITKAMQRLGSLIITAILMSLVIGIGFFFFVIPGFFAMFFLIFTIAIVVIEDMSPIKAMIKSYKLVRRSLGNTFIYVGIAVFIILISGVIGKILEAVPIIGKLILSPALSGVVMAYIYTVLTIFYREVKA